MLVIIEQNYEKNSCTNTLRTN